VSKNGVFEPDSLPGFWTRQYPLIIPILTGFGANWRGPKNGQGELADLDTLDLNQAKNKLLNHNFELDSPLDICCPRTLTPSGRAKTGMVQIRVTLFCRL
jgi:hypothetical protein